jgi:hypothetical protein
VEALLELVERIREHAKTLRHGLSPDLEGVGQIGKVIVFRNSLVPSILAVDWRGVSRCETP